MFQSLSAAVQNALAPDVPPIVDFRHQWNLFLRFYAENKPLSHKSQPVEKTNLVFHLNNMLKLLMQEQRDIQATAREESIVGPCMEYLIHHQMLDILSSICQADTPPGIRPYILNLFIFLLARIQHTLILPYVNVYMPMRRLLMLSASMKASPTENQEITFVATLVTKLKSTPELLTLFAHACEPGDVSHSSSRRSSNAASSIFDLSQLQKQFDEQCSSIFQDMDSQHLIVNALFNLVESADYVVSVKAMDSLLVVCGLPDESAAINAVEGSNLPAQIASRLIRFYQAIPKDVEIAMIEEVRVSWVEAHHLHSRGSSLPDFHGKSELVSFFSWLDFCDNLIKGSLATIGEQVARAIRENFLENVVEIAFTELSSDTECDNSSETVHLLALLMQMWVHIHSECLANEFAQWLFGDNKDPELNGVTTHPLKHAMLQLCTDQKQEVTLETLSLFDVILERPCDPILQTLVLCSLNSRGYFNASLAESSIASWSDEEDEREKIRTPVQTTPVHTVNPTGHRSNPTSPVATLSRTMAPTNIARVINAWLYLVPDELRSSDAAKDSGYEQYVKNAQHQVAETFKKCDGFRHWPREATFYPDRSGSDSSSSDSRPEADPTRIFYEGEFLDTLFNMLESLLERDYDVNLQVTALISRLCQLPHPYLHEYLLNPTIPLATGARSLYTSMQKVLQKVKQQTKDVDQLKRKIYLCRKTLLGSELDRQALNLTRDETKVIDGLIILEEFSKEIAAITLVKYHLAS